MKEINIFAKSTEEGINQMQDHFGGSITERWGEHVLEFDNEIGKGCIKFISFDWGVSLVEFNAIFFDDILLINKVKNFNPIHFSYCSKGYFEHRFSNQSEFNVIEQYHAAIIVSRDGLDHFTLIPNGVHLEMNNIRIVRQEFLKKRLNNVEQLNEKLHEVFVDKNEKEFAYFSPIHLKMEDHVKALRDIETEGMTRILQIEGEVYQLLSMHISRHDRHHQNDDLPSSLTSKELKIIKRQSKRILDDPSINYSLEQLSKNSGLSQAKLQEGFKFLYARTVTEYIRHVRLEAARDLMGNSDLNISQIVYTIGFTSRSYFSKIFKEKYGITPHEFKKQIVYTIEEEL
ncbi:AraC family transcriptional regulator [Subsaxibacter sp. CAU 1640]|uniref:helix-turn-helix transcriptional regulator n=1 Tax=Subsaxibacter sp. CAU 1640 TaxID=2933271 RepID=UPI002005C0AB|nr:AraC family transcriptional regulator [Subsaxibacter sp. CAU 1640]MCK7591806.1 AraC family transcriptional regulator [Subsaxibacter sp. CAU 1640]